MAMKLVKRVGFLTIGTMGGGVAYRYYTDEGTRRSFAFWPTALPLFFQYKYMDYKTRNDPQEVRDAKFEELHNKYAPIVEKKCLELRGFYLKNAQLMSTVDQFIPKQYLEFCKRMQSEVPTEFKPGEVKQVIERNLNLNDISDLFEDFEEIPIGSASIGQVHLAKLKTTGELVAIKVMAPGVERRFRADIATIIDFCRIAMPQHVGPMQEIQKQFLTEFDYVGEAENLNQVRNNILPIYGNIVSIPKPFMEYCTKEVLVMEYLPGPSLVKGIRASYEKYAKSVGKTLEQLEKEQKELMEKPDFKMADVLEEAKKMKRFQTLLKYKNWILNLIGWGPNGQDVELINLGEIIVLLCQVHGHEILIDGAFSADPHPGNILLMPNGKLGLIDMGQFKKIPTNIRLLLARLIVALAHEDAKECIKIMKELGNKSKYGKEDIQYRLIQFWFDKNSKDVIGDMNIQQFMDYCESEDPSVKVNDDIIMAGRVSIMMRGLGNAFGLYVTTAKLWCPIAEKVLKENNIEYIPKKTLPDYTR